jgi:hypothetical protein
VLAYYSASISAFGKRSCQWRPEGERVYRAAAEAVLAATLLVFLFAYLNLNRWHVRYSHVTAAWLIFLAALIGLAVFHPPIAAGRRPHFHRGRGGGPGFVLVLYLSTHGYDRAVLLDSDLVFAAARLGGGGKLWRDGSADR